MTTGYTPGAAVAHNMVTTQFELDGYRVTKTLGVVRGIVVRSRSIFGTIGASLQTCRREHQPVHAIVREDPRRCLRPDAATRRPTRRECGGRGTL